LRDELRQRVEQWIGDEKIELIFHGCNRYFPPRVYSPVG
jgi:hypothetical protein